MRQPPAVSCATRINPHSGTYPLHTLLNTYVATSSRSGKILNSPILRRKRLQPVGQPGPITTLVEHPVKQ